LLRKNYAYRVISKLWELQDVTEEEITISRDEDEESGKD